MLREMAQTSGEVRLSLARAWTNACPLLRCIHCCARLSLLTEHDLVLVLRALHPGGDRSRCLRACVSQVMSDGTISYCAQQAW